LAKRGDEEGVKKEVVSVTVTEEEERVNEEVVSARVT
jgi:hypothetical protein